MIPCESVYLLYLHQGSTASGTMEAEPRAISLGAVTYKGVDILGR